MKLDSVKITGFKSIKDADIKLGNLNVLIGANGAGKTNFISLFKFFSNMIEGNLQNLIALGSNAENFLFFGSKTTDFIKIELKFGKNGYIAKFKPDTSDRLVFVEEICQFKGEDYGEPFEEFIGSGHTETLLNKYKEGKPVVQYVIDGFKSWKYYHFHDTSDTAKIKKYCYINDYSYLRTDASNLATFLYVMKAKNEDHYNAIIDAIRLVAPFFDNFILRPNPLNEDNIRIEWFEKGSDFPFFADHFSDGTLRFICLATVLLQPNLPSTIIIDEPELGLHPYAIKVLASLMRATAKKTQLIISTQSVPLVNEFEPKDLIIVDKINKASVFKRITKKALEEWLKDYTLGELWEKNVLGGRPQ